MATIAPWLIPTDTLAAIRSGAGTGLQLRQQRFAEYEAERRRIAAAEEAAARRALAAEQFQANREEAAERLQQARLMGAERLAQAKSEAEALAGHRKEQEDIARAALDLRKAQQDAITKRLTEPVTGKPILDEQGNPIEGFFAVPDIHGSFNVTRKPSNTVKELSPYTQSRMWESQLKRATIAKEDAATDAERTAAQADIKEASDALRALRPKLPTGTNSPIGVTNDRVRVKKGDKVGSVPRSQLQQAIAEGYTVIE